MTGTDRRDGGRRLVPMATVAVRPATARGGDQRPAEQESSHGGGRPAAVPRRSRGLRRPPGEEERTTGTAGEGRARAASPGHEDAVTDTLRRDDAVTDTLHRDGAVTGLPTTPSRVPLPEPARRSGPRDAREARPSDSRPPGARPTPPTGHEPTAPAPAQASSSPDPDPDDADDDDALGGLVPVSSEDSAPADGDTRRRRRLVWPAVAGVLVLALAGGAFFARDLWGVFFPPDFAGPATGHVVVQVADGDSTRDIGETLVADGVVASARGFGDAAEDDPRGRGIQPGFYDMQRGMPAATAVTRMLDPANRLGRLEVRGGTQLDDTAGAGSARVPGVLSLISQATCVVADSGQRRCTSADDLRRTMVATDPAQLGVPDWALADVRRAAPERRLEGLVAPGTYDVTPGADARTALASVVRTSTGRLEAAGLVSGAAANNVSPYQALVVGSLAEREGVEQDFGKIARVVYNRLPIPMRLQLDSTINYPLDRQTLLTTPVDRAAPGPYNTYLDFGLPPTPIGAVSTPALQAAISPAPGGWIYFVKCEPDGASCFAVTPAEHDANRRLAQARGVY
ncbi:MAG TPA: endolytic transglycosylase MltG [Actinomycetospora sp.]|uniref:endolytic transglycosylase MltG n=1 Tax=Actinomycetospora sp. TaxID=1872135 RepID=UPI002F3E8CF3